MRLWQLQRGPTGVTREDCRVEVGFKLGLEGKHNADPRKENVSVVEDAVG